MLIGFASSFVFYFLFINSKPLALQNAERGFNLCIIHGRWHNSLIFIPVSVFLDKNYFLFYVGTSASLHLGSKIRGYYFHKFCTVKHVFKEEEFRIDARKARSKSYKL